MPERLIFLCSIKFTFNPKRRRRSRGDLGNAPFSAPAAAHKRIRVCNIIPFGLQIQDAAPTDEERKNLFGCTRSSDRFCVTQHYFGLFDIFPLFNISVCASASEKFIFFSSARTNCFWLLPLRERIRPNLKKKTFRRRFSTRTQPAPIEYLFFADAYLPGFMRC